MKLLVTGGAGYLGSVVAAQPSDNPITETAPAFRQKTSGRGAPPSKMG